MALYQPAWLLFLIPLAVAWLLWPLPTRLLRALRAGTFVLLVLALCRPALRLPDRAGTVVVIADRSESMPPQSFTAQKEIIDLVQSTMRPRDRLAVIAFAKKAAVEHPPQTGKFAGFLSDVGKDQSHLASALETALALVPEDGVGRVLMLSDGRHTGRNPAELVPRFAARGIALDFRLFQRSSAQDVAVYLVQAPESVAPKQAFMLTAWVRSPVSQESAYELRCGSQLLAAGKKAVSAGLSRLMFRDRAEEPGVRSYTLTVAGSGQDPVPENNAAKLLVGVRGRRPVLCVTAAGARSGFARALKEGGVEVRPRAPGECRWALEDLAQYAAVVVENTLANAIGSEGMENLAAWVQSAAGGFMMTGGKLSYGPGGYFKSPLERILPISMELRQEHRKLSVAIVIAMDRSGSMQMPAGGGKRKMDLADLGAAEVLDMLSPVDEIGVIAVDSQAHVIVDLDTVDRNRAHRDRILRIDSMGGGIFIYEALQAACGMVAKAKAGTRHIILFADAADSEEPGAYKQLLEKAQQANVTVSVVGMGTERDCDAGLLKDIAERGGGRIFFSADAAEIPRLFAQDTFAVARSTFVEDPTSIRLTSGLATLTALRFGEPPAMGGYNLCYARPDANVAALTLDEYKAPIVASWHVGNGRALCYMGEADGEFAGPFAQWKDASALLGSLAKWTAGEEAHLAGSAVVTQQVHEGLYALDLHLDPERTSDPFTAAPKVKMLRGLPGGKPLFESYPLDWKSADQLSLEVPMSGSETLLATVEVPGRGHVTLTPVCLPYSLEFRPDEANEGRAALEHLAQASGGKERVNVTEIWKDLPKKPRYVDIAPWLLILALLLLLVEVFQRRTGLLSIWRDRMAAEPEPAPSARRLREVVAQASCLPPSRVGASDAGRMPALQPQPAAEPPQPEPTPQDSTIAAMRMARMKTRGKP